MPPLLRTLLRPSWRWHLSRRALRHWEQQSRPIPPPPAFKQAVVREMARRYKTRQMVETGTYQGEMVAACRKAFERIVTVELDGPLFRRAQQLFAGDSRVTVLHGDSAHLLPEILADVTAPCLFWLDGHYSGEGTSKADTLDDGTELHTPIREELRLILGHPIKNHVILIDDARAFLGAYSCPTLDELREMVARHGQNYEMSVKYDAIRLLPCPRSGLLGR
jgi:hypothetical protein